MSDRHLDDRALPPLTPAATAHVAQCAECAAELQWRRAERALFDRRRTTEGADAGVLWQRIEAEIARGERDRSAQGAAAPAAPRGRAAWFGAGFAAAAAIASLLAVSVGDRDAADGAPATATADAPIPGDDDGVRPIESSSQQALADAERAYERALDLTEADYLAKRDSLPPDVAIRIDDSLRDTRRLRADARALAGDDVDARLLLLDTYAAQLHTLQAALDDID
jgi:hypothetical protein